MLRFSIILFVTMLGASWLPATSSRAEIKIIVGPLPTAGEFDLEKKTRRSLSGIACPVVVDGKHVCLVAFDEGAEARTIAINETEYEVRKKSIVLGPADGEMDAEAVAADGAYYYVSGSHADKRNPCKVNEGSHRLVRIAYNPATGLPIRKSDGKLQDVEDGFDITKVLNDDLTRSVGKCLGSQEGGFDIEGMAAYDGRLYFGLRGPTAPDETAAGSGAIAYVFEAGTSPSLVTQDNAKDPFRIPVANGRAIRDMASVDKGILLLFGPDDDNRDVGWSIALWKVDEEADRKTPVNTIDLGPLDLSEAKRAQCDKEVKPEGMAVLGSHSEGSDEVYRLAIFSDGMCDGGPVIVDAMTAAQ
ncbi:hypothetical protein B5K05_13225 [Rhizobium phaseoli]|uniref:DUF3616 domain-containing protein n=1 Tax=Rhizobium phaseoli TaxID=396 RepID=UPI000E0CEC7B|nr:DUF3616 domain-containing protein [Rhizobium phaseoli]RDJ10091.1 hypothetical protein B5K04_13200 [Rhizobium phaseoli]RDJ14091.1 hypothetical protein B5K05_13225 [Rhizobium phaseoli]